MDPFTTLGIEKRFDLDLKEVEKAHRELSRALHPDKFVQAGASERRSALEKAAEVNEAWRVVRDPIRRAEALFRLHGVEVGDTEPKSQPSFLMDMLEQREALAEARAAKDLKKVQELGEAMAVREKAAHAKLAAGLAKEGDVSSLLPELGELRFYRRFLDEVEATMDEAEEAAS